MIYDMYSFQPVDDRMNMDRKDMNQKYMDQLDIDRMDMDQKYKDKMDMSRMKTDRMGMDQMEMDRMEMQPGRDGMKYMNEELVRTLQDCEAACEHMSHHIKRLPDFRERFRQAVFLRDCADICALTAKALARHSLIGMNVTELCARTCEACAKECAKFNDQMSQNCSKICMHCARECARFTGMQM